MAEDASEGATLLRRACDLADGEACRLLADMSARTVTLSGAASPTMF